MRASSVTRREWLRLVRILPLTPVVAGFLRPATRPAAAAKPTSVPAIATFRDGPGDRIASDGRGAYIDGIDRVAAYIDNRGDFDMDMSPAGAGAPIRRINLDFQAPASADVTPPFQSGLDDAFMSTGAGGLPQMTVGTSIRSKLGVNFSLAGLGWFIRFSPTDYPDTSNVLVTRTASDRWDIEAAPTDIAKLLSYVPKGKLVLTDRGNFFLPFKVTVTLQ
jgi:hypothetical protein